MRRDFSDPNSLLPIEMEFCYSGPDLEEYMQTARGASSISLMLPKRGKVKWRRKYHAPIMLGVAAISCALLILLTRVSFFGIAALMVGAFALVSVFTSDTILDWRVEQAYKFELGTQTQYRVRITNRRICFEADGTRAVLPWEKFKQFRETPCLFVLMITSQESPLTISVLVPKRVFASEQQIDHFRRHLRAKCKCFSGFPLD
jgi:hypothetical protein